ncbi:hypothetical protein HDU76_004428, partial [Blyttiomyces sp. JEL0837]
MISNTAQTAITSATILPLSSSPSSYWDLLPDEIKQIILSQCDLLTKYLNKRLEGHQVSKHAHQIWNLAIKFNFTGDVTLLPTSLPN